MSSITPTSPLTMSALGLDDEPEVTFNLYRDVHKGIRNELFAVTAAVGLVDSSDPVAVGAVARHLASVTDLLELHAHHEDAAIDPALQIHLPRLAEEIRRDHQTFDELIAVVNDKVSSASTGRTTDRRLLLHSAYLDLSGFVSSYLAHQLLEERIVMPQLELAVGVDAVMAIHGQILAAIPPDEMMTSLAVMLPAMNVDDQVELLSGMRASAPVEAFEGVVGLASSVLDPRDFDLLTRRLGA